MALFVPLAMNGQNTTVTASKITSASVTWTGSAGETWNVTITGGATNQNVTNGYAQFGTRQSYSTKGTFSTSGISGTITSIDVDCASYNGAGTVSVTVGGAAFGSSQSIPSWSNNAGGTRTFTGSASGEIVVTMTNGSSTHRAMYIKSITVTYTSTTPSITLDPASATVFTGFTQTLTATTSNVTGTPTITYTSNNTSVATVSGSGTTATVTGVSAGTATITASMTYEGNTYTGECAITVEDPSYCTPNPTSRDGQGITTLTFGSGNYTVNNSNSSGLPASSPYYADYTSMVGGYEQGETATVTITYSTGSSTVYSYGTVIWVDWNKNYTFEDDEIVYTGTSAQGSNGTPQELTATFTIPASQAADDYRMRIAGADSYFDSYISGTTSADHDPCFTSTYAVCHDYTLRVTQPNPCVSPTNLQADQVVSTSAQLSWDGENDSYVLQYRTGAHDNMDQWEQVGEDIIGTATLTQYTFDLSDFSGTGNIAIRHYNVSDMFRVVIDDIVVTDAGGEEIVNEGFESSVPSAWQIVDYDGDGYNWERASFSSEGVQNGSYCMSSESWVSGTGALTPDNWMIIPNVALGGTLTFYMRGTDASFPQENIGVFVTTASLDDVFSTSPAGNWSADIPVATNSHNLTGLTANTPYEWRVKGICNDYPDPSNWASSNFTTIPENFKIFITEGNWNVADNWFPAGVPTSTDEVSIEAPVTIPAGVVATAKRVDINGGSILIKEGGQLKQGAATVRVTMEKAINGYGDGDGNYYFIASPFSGRTLYQESGTWSRVDNMLTGEYDLYAFDLAAALEWINYKANSTHISFQSDNGNAGLMYGEGYLYANQDATTLNFVGTTGKSINHSETLDYTFDSESTDDWNGWEILGNFFSCNAYINYVDASGNTLPFELYVMNEEGNGFKLAASNVLPPLTAAFIKVNTSGKILYSTEPVAVAAASGSVESPCLPSAHGATANQDALECLATLDTITITVTGHTATLTYNGSEQSVTGYDLTCEDELFDASLVTFSGEADSTAKGTDAGEYAMGLDAEMFGYDNNNLVAIFTIADDGMLTIGKKAATVVADNLGKTYGESDPELTAAVEGMVGEDVLAYSLSREDGDTVGTYAITVTLGENPNYEVSATNGVFTITPASMTVNVTGNTSTAFYTGSEQRVEGYSLACESALYDETLVNFTGTAVATGTTVGTYPMGLESAQFSYNNSNIDVTFEVTDGWLEITSCFKILVDETNTEWKEDFEDAGHGSTTPYTGYLPACWSVPMEYTSDTNDVTPPQVYYKPEFNATEGGSYSLRMRFRSMLAMPELDENVDFEHLQMSLYVRQSFWAYKLEIGVVTDINNPDSTYTMVATVNNSDKNMDYFECNFSSVNNLTGPGRYIVFKNVGGSEGDLYCNNYLDDITLTYVDVENLDCRISDDYTETFEGYMVGTEPDCWEVITEDVALESGTRPQVYSGFNTTANGNQSLRLKNRCVYAMPEFQSGYNVSNYTMTFQLRQPKSIYRLQVGVVDEQGEFTPVKTLKCSGTEFEEKTVDFSTYEGEGRIAFRNTLVPGTGMSTEYLDYSVNYIDDINIIATEDAKVDANEDNLDADDVLENIAVYPNPTTGNLYIEAIGIQKVECYNQMGQLVRVYDNVVNSVDLNVLADGVYMLRITVPQGVTMRKVVKRRNN